MQVACLDTMILSYAIVEHAPNNAPHYAITAKDFLRHIATVDYKIIIPNTVVSELLTAIPVEDQAQVFAQLNQDYRIVPYDNLSALIYGRLARTMLVNRQRNGLMEIKRKILKADLMILATAIAHRADVLFTQDDKFQRIASNYIEVKSMEDEPFQHSMQFPEPDSEN